ncbi:hypothetical protein F4861DRAFT_507365 [Xylaria intraflava]|nr:hypothetical protein F4861DRAFT_507365 [Xylaria intraflava]
MERPSAEVSPFRVCVLGTQANELDSLLPASFRTEHDYLAQPKLYDTRYFQKELGVERLSLLHKWLWLAGRPMPPRPLHYQLLQRREIVIAEQIDLHLVWTSGRMFLKPIPRYLLEPKFWTTYLACQHDPPCTHAAANPCTHHRLWRCALGFLFSYAALICYESDFLLAQERHLLPREVRWQSWRKLVEELGTEHIYDRIHPRYIYGELRLSRLNKIESIRAGFSFRGYMSSWTRYEDFFSSYFTLLASATVYIAIVLTAMQVGLATDALAQNRAFQSASYGFTVFSIIGPLAAGGLIFGYFLFMFYSNVAVTVRYRKERVRHVHSMRTESEHVC